MIYRYYHLILYVCLAWNTGIAQPIDTAAIKKQLALIHERDQMTRRGTDSVQYANYIDSTNLIVIEDLISKYGWLNKSFVGVAGNRTCFLVIQHADLATQEKYLPMMESSVAMGESSTYDLALLQDRILMRQGKHQIYGSQIVRDESNGQWKFYPIEDERHVNARRAKVGLRPIEEDASYFGIDYKVEQLPDLSKYKEGFVTSPDVKLHYLDWQSDKPALILITGLGDTPYLYESLAGALSNDFRVIAYARRDHELSRSFNKKYDNATLVYDLKLLMDSLHIQKAHLLGWSMGGNEITGFATIYPHRVDKLVYFEAGYDMSDPGFSIMVSAIPESAYATEADMQSIDAYRVWYHNFWAGDVEWNDVLENNFQGSTHARPDGSVENVPSDSIFQMILSEAMQYHRSYKKINAPALVIYAPTFLHSPTNDPEMLDTYDQIDASIVIPWRNRSREQVKRQLKNATILEMPTGSHISFLFLNEALLVKSIREFLKS